MAMKLIQHLMILFTILICLGCKKLENNNFEITPVRYNIVVILDGTDRLQTENVVPIVSGDDLQNIASKMLGAGVGTLYVSFVDNNSDNNQAVILDFDEKEPMKPGPRPSYVPVSEYRTQILEPFNQDSIDYANSKALHMRAFDRDCAHVLEQAYSDIVATNKCGSDVHGAINQAYRLLKPNLNGEYRSIIILVSDGVDNVGKELQAKPEDVELYLVNGMVSKHSLGDIIDIEFVTINQVLKNIFN